MRVGRLSSVRIAESGGARHDPGQVIHRLRARIACRGCAGVFGTRRHEGPRKTRKHEGREGLHRAACLLFSRSRDQRAVGRFQGAIRRAVGNCECIEQSWRKSLRAESGLLFAGWSEAISGFGARLLRAAALAMTVFARAHPAAAGWVTRNDCHSRHCIPPRGIVGLRMKPAGG